MSDRFDALMVELGEELASLTPTDGDEMIRMSAIERGDRLEVLTDRLATRGAELTTSLRAMKERAQALSLTLALMEQSEIGQSLRGMWWCLRCRRESADRTAIPHDDECPYSIISDGAIEVLP